MHRVVQEGVLHLGVYRVVVVNGCVRALHQVVVKAGSPLARPQASCVGAIVHHEGHPTRVHIRVQRVHSLDDGLVAHLGVGVALLAQYVNLRHHHGHIYASSERVHWDLGLHALRAHLLTNLPHLRAVDLLHGVDVEAGHGIRHGAQLSPGLHVLVALHEDVLAGHEGGVVGGHEHLLVGVVERQVHRVDPGGGDGLGDGARDALHRVLEGLLGGHALPGVAVVQGLHDAVHAAQQDAALAEDVGAVLHLKGGGEREGGAEGHRPAQRHVGGVAGGVLVHGEGGVDARAVDVLALLVQTTHRGPHALGGHKHHVDVVAELCAVVLHDAQKEPVRQPKRGSRLHGRQDARVHLSLRAVRDEQQDQLRLRDDLKNLAQGSVLLGEAAGFCLCLRGRSSAEADLHLDVDARLGNGVAQVLSLGRSLRAPSDDPDGLDALKCLGKQVVQVAPALDDVLRLPGHIHLFLVKDLAIKVHSHRRSADCHLLTSSTGQLACLLQHWRCLDESAA
mmetsp:Transcript_31421/g.60588  ORF Transcript_31421/g.60588 Transcript_31421/m.60588 type:complete len:506 (+) Transcript_31421:387-1904(+)